MISEHSVDLQIDNCNNLQIIYSSVVHFSWSDIFFRLLIFIQTSSERISRPDLILEMKTSIIPLQSYEFFLRELSNLFPLK